MGTDRGDEADVVRISRVSGSEQSEPAGEAEPDHADRTSTDLSMQGLRCQADGRDGSRRDAKIGQLFYWRGKNRYATCGERPGEADQPRLVDPKPMDSVQQNDAWRMYGIPRDVQAAAKLFVFPREAEWFFVNRVTLKIRQPAAV